MTHSPRNDAWERCTRESFARQGAMRSIGARIDALEPGRCTIVLPFRDDLSQQHGYFHAGMTSAIADSAGGYAGHTLMPARSEVLTVEFKINLVAPADGSLLIAQAGVVRSGRTLTICTAEVSVERDGTRQLCAIMQQTLMRVEALAL